MNLLITGGAGFVGASLALAIKQKWPNALVTCMDNLYRRGSELNLARLREADIQFIHGDVREPQAFPEIPHEFLIECSAEPSVLAGLERSPDYLIRTNLTGAYHCLEQARKWQGRIIFFSTSRVYPILRLESHRWRETSTRFTWENEGIPGISSRGVNEMVDMSGARSLYGFTKYAAELLIEEYRAAYGLKAVVNRCGVIAGPGQFGKVDQGVVALWVMAHQFGRPLEYLGYGGQGKQVRDLLHIHDLCQLVLEQIEHFDAWDGWSGNVSGGFNNSVSLVELTDLCREIMHRQIPIAANPASRPFDLRIYIGDCSRLYERTSWRPRCSVRQIVHDTVDWVARCEGQLAALR